MCRKMLSRKSPSASRAVQCSGTVSYTHLVDTVKPANGYEMKSVWCRNDLSDTSILKLSTATGYIYGYVQDVTCLLYTSRCV